MIQLTPIFSLKLRLNALLFATASAVLTTGLSAAEQPSFTPLRSGPRAASKPSRQKQIPSSSTIRPQSMPALRSNLGQLPRSADRKRVKQPPSPPCIPPNPGFRDLPAKRKFLAVSHEKTAAKKILARRIGSLRSPAMKTVLKPPGSSKIWRGSGTFRAETSAIATSHHCLRPSSPRNPLSPPSAPVQRRLQGPPAKSNFLAVNDPFPQTTTCPFSYIPTLSRQLNT